MEWVYQSILEPLSYFVSLDKRLHILYLFSSLCMAYIIYRKQHGIHSFWVFVFPKHIWKHSSTHMDYAFLFFNGFTKLLCVAPLVVISYELSFYTSEKLRELFGFIALDISITWLLLIYTISVTVIGDFANFVVHLLMHKIPFLWRFHAVHHSAEVLTPFTQYRIHPVELIINNLRRFLVFGLITGIFDFLSKEPISFFTFLGVQIFQFFFLFIGSNLRHSHIPFSYPTALEHIFISPLQHQIHHSVAPEHIDKNFGSKFALWDYLFGTLVVSKNSCNLDYGIQRKNEAKKPTFLEHLKGL